MAELVTPAQFAANEQRLRHRELGPRSLQPLFRSAGSYGSIEMLLRWLQDEDDDYRASAVSGSFNYGGLIGLGVILAEVVGQGTMMPVSFNAALSALENAVLYARDATAWRALTRQSTLSEFSRYQIENSVAFVCSQVAPNERKELESADMDYSFRYLRNRFIDADVAERWNIVWMMKSFPKLNEAREFLKDLVDSEEVGLASSYTLSCFFGEKAEFERFAELSGDEFRERLFFNLLCWQAVNYTDLLALRNVEHRSWRFVSDGEIAESLEWCKSRILT